MQTLLEDEALVQPLPALHEVASMDLATLIATLTYAAEIGPSGAGVVAACLICLGILVQRPGMDDAAASGGGIDASITAMGSLSATIGVQTAGCEFLAISLKRARAESVAASLLGGDIMDSRSAG